MSVEAEQAEAWRRQAEQRGAGEFTTALRVCMGLAFAMMLLFSPHYPWYIVWLVPFFTLLPRWTLLAYLMAFFYGFTTRYANPGPLLFLLDKWLYGAVALAFAVQWAWVRWDVGRWFVVGSVALRPDYKDPSLRSG